MDYTKFIAEHTGTNKEDWENMDGPETGVGVEYWYCNEKTGSEAYVCNDQGHVTITVDDECIYDDEEITEDEAA